MIVMAPPPLVSITALARTNERGETDARGDYITVRIDPPDLPDLWGSRRLSRQEARSLARRLEDMCR